MDNDTIKEIFLDSNDQLCLVPEKSRFPYVYREAMEGKWDVEGKYLHSPKPRDWSYLDWYKQMIKCAELQGVQLRLSDDTIWKNISSELKQQIQSM